MEKSQIYEKIASILEEVKPIAKDRKNTQQNYSFRGVDDVMNALSPILTKHRVFPICSKIEDISSEKVTSNRGAEGWRQVKRFTFKFNAEDGSSVETMADGESIDYGDKGSNKCYSVAYREALFKMFIIPFGNDDIENADHELVPKTPAKPLPPKKPVSVKTQIFNQLKALRPEVSKDNVKEITMELTKLELIEGNFDEINTRLEVLINEHGK